MYISGPAKARLTGEQVSAGAACHAADVTVVLWSSYVAARTDHDEIFRFNSCETAVRHLRHLRVSVSGSIKAVTCGLPAVAAPSWLQGM